LPVSVILAVLATGMLSLLLGYCVLVPAAMRSNTTALVVAIGISIMIQNILATLWTSEARPFYPELPQFQIGDSGVSAFHIGIVLLALLLLTLIWFGFFRRTDLGLETRACASNIHAARILGVRFTRVLLVVFFLSGLLAGVAGIAVGIDNRLIVPSMGTALGLRAFIASVIGGARSFRGAIAGSFVLGILENLVPLAFASVPGLAVFSALVSKDSVALVLLVVVLLWRHHGLFAVAYEGRP
jgi:branched-chain amino acid transport system permease protein